MIYHARVPVLQYTSIRLQFRLPNREGFDIAPTSYFLSIFDVAIESQIEADLFLQSYDTFVCDYISIYNATVIFSSFRCVSSNKEGFATISASASASAIFDYVPDPTN